MSVASATNRPLSWLKLVFARMTFWLVRLCERLLPPTLLSLLLWPPAAAWDLVHIHRRKLVSSWRSFPDIWHPKPAPFFLRQSLGLSHAQLVCIWPDRLCTPRWLSRCRLEGRVDLIRPRDGDRGIVLASAHFGPNVVLPYWLRAHGIALTSVHGPLPSRQDVARHLWALSPPADVPIFLLVNEMSHLRQLLRSGRHLGLMVDVNRGKQVCVPFENHAFRMATGAIRLAALAGAELIPCLIRETALWKFVIHFGDPVPRHCLGNPPDLKGAAAHLLEEFLKVIRCHPEHCNHRLLSAISPAAEVSGISAVPASASWTHTLAHDEQQ